jgi:hypothetical protein
VVLSSSEVLSSVWVFLVVLPFSNAIVYYALLFLMLLFSFVTMPPLLSHAYKFKAFFSFHNFKVGGPLIILTSDKTSSFHGPNLASSPFLNF